jgi:hypothetical protein
MVTNPCFARGIILTVSIHRRGATYVHNLSVDGGLDCRRREGEGVDGGIVVAFTVRADGTGRLVGGIASGRYHYQETSLL